MIHGKVNIRWDPETQEIKASGTYGKEPYVEEKKDAEGAAKQSGDYGLVRLL